MYGKNSLLFYLLGCSQVYVNAMRYIGGKSLLTKYIIDAIRKKAIGAVSVTDLFAGTGAVGLMLKQNKYAVVSNDLLYFSYVLNRGQLEMSTPPSKYILEIIDYLNNINIDASSIDTSHAFIYQNYSPHDGCQRMYFRNDNALKIDVVRQEIERLRGEISETEYFYLLSLLIKAVPYVSNITGTYGAYLKYWDKRTYNPLMLEIAPVIDNGIECHCYQLNALDLARIVHTDVFYLDPPYNQRQYLPNYHLLETIARYDYPKIKGVTGVREDPEMISDFCKKRKVADVFRQLLKAIDCRYVLISYNNEGLLSTEQLSAIVRESGKSETFCLKEFDYRRYKNRIPNNKPGLKEQLYFIEK